MFHHQTRRPRAGHSRRGRLFITALTMALLATIGLTSPAFAASKNLCVFDVSGANGDSYAAMKEFQAEAAGWGVDFELKPYTNEKTAADDFKAGKCDAVLVTGTRARPFNKFSSTVEAMGALPEYKLLKAVVRLLAKPKAGKLMKEGDYETVAILPLGKVYLFVDNKEIDTIEELAGKTIATLDYDEAAKVMVKEAGASISAADVSTFSGMFNNGAVNAAYAPGSAFKPLELEKGLKGGGGVIRYPLAQLTMQLVIRTDDFPDDFGNKSRKWAADYFKTALNKVKKAEKQIPGKYWVDISDDDKARYDRLFLDVRVRLRDKEKVFDGNMLKVMRRIRCKLDDSRAECAEKRE